MKIGLVAAGDIVAAYSLPDGEPTEEMISYYTVCVGANLDTEAKTVNPEVWPRIKAALLDQDDIEVQDFTTA